MTEFEDEKPNKIPEKLRVSADEKDAEAFLRLLTSDEYQKELAERFNFKPETPKERERARALIVTQTLTDFANLSLEQLEQLSEAYASLGEYQTARDLTVNSDKKAEYQQLWDAVWLDDSEWCEHPENHKFIKDNIFSVKENREMPLLKCNFCGMLNVLDAPEHLTDAQRKRAGVRESYRKTESINDALKWHQQNVK